MMWNGGMGGFAWLWMLFGAVFVLGGADVVAALTSADRR